MLAAPFKGVTYRDRTWLPAALGPAADRYAWRSRSATWEATPGEYTLMARAEDEVGSQPVDQLWNPGDMATTMAERVEVVVQPPGRTTT